MTEPISETCPRCGGPPAPKRQPTSRNPFLPKVKRLTCSLCGLVYDKGAPPWGPGDTDPGEDPDRR
ncbi:MAG: hypothetical protein JNL21_04900 [Myxococcales bacterium]|nr:hypothetical protein [Myxococcales bacterium]